VGKTNQQRRRMKEKERRRRPPTSPREGWAMATDQPTLEERAALDVAAALRALAYDDKGVFLPTTCDRPYRGPGTGGGSLPTWFASCRASSATDMSA